MVCLLNNVHELYFDRDGIAEPDECWRAGCTSFIVSGLHLINLLQNGDASRMERCIDHFIACIYLRVMDLEDTIILKKTLDYVNETLLLSLRSPTVEAFCVDLLSCPLISRVLDE